MADLGLIDALFLLIPKDIHKCTYHTFKYIWQFYGVSRVQVSHIDPIGSPIRTTYDALAYKSPYSECYHEYMQDLYRIATSMFPYEFIW